MLTRCVAVQYNAHTENIKNTPRIWDKKQQLQRGNIPASIDRNQVNRDKRDIIICQWATEY